MKPCVECIIAVITLLLADIVCAAGLDMVLTAPREPTHGGDTVVMDLSLHNATDTAIIYSVISPLSCRLFTGQTELVLKAVLVSPEGAVSVEIPGREFVRLQYCVTLPIYFAGIVHLSLMDMGINPLTFIVERAPPDEWEGQQVPLDQGFTMGQSFLEDMSFHEPIFFLLGVDPGPQKSSFQLSLKYRFFNSKGYLAEKAPWVSNFYFGYTQYSLWDLKDDSRPFEDTSYIPEFFYLFPKIDLNVKRITSFGVQSGFRHESNGKGGDDSRSTNYLYIKPIMGIWLTGPYYLKVAPQILTYINNTDSTNEDLMDYRGYFGLETGIGDPKGIALNSHLRWASKGVSVNLDLTYPMTLLMSRSLNLYLDMNYFSGYAETLLNYNERYQVLRVGFSIVR